MPRREKTVFATPKWVGMDGYAHVTWATDGNLNKAPLNAKVTARKGIRRFRYYRYAVAFARRQGKRMGPGTKVIIHGARSETGGQTYVVK